MKIKPLFTILAPLALAFFLIYINQIKDLLLMAIILSVTTLSCSLYILCYRHIKGVYNRKIRERDILESLAMFLHYNSRGVTSFHSLSQIIENSNVPDLKVGFAQVRMQARLGRRLGEALERFFSEHEFSSSINFMDGNAFIPSLRKFLALSSKSKSLSSSVALDSLQRNSTVNMFLSTLLPSFLLFIFVGTTVLSPSSIGLVLISLMVLIFVPSVYAISSTIFSRRLIAETV